MFTKALSTAWLMDSTTGPYGGWGVLRRATCLRPGPAGRCGQRGPLMPVGSLAGGRHREPAKPSQYLLLYLLAVWLLPEGPPGPPSCSEAPGRNPSPQWPHLPAPQSNQPGAGRGVRGSQESVSGQGRGGSYTHVLDQPSRAGGGARIAWGKSPRLVLLTQRDGPGLEPSDLRAAELLQFNHRPISPKITAAVSP